MTTDERDRQLAEAVALRERGEREEARGRLLALAGRWPEDREIAYQTAWAHDVLGLEAEAVPFYERALAGDGPGNGAGPGALSGAGPGTLSDEDRAGAMLGLGSTYRVLGRYEDAERLLRRAVELFPDHGGLRTFLAMALHNTGRHEESIRLLLELLAATSDDPTVAELRPAIAFYAKDLSATA
ncbi:tetratricopeptide repeat protein [Streptomyces purpureus]|uniref:Tetratricopeptide repeat protein n=1 Tax=Streptomyces purpureus TaxID=1951 RepID=A0A918LTW0_9ACTN|nr:tetratricopeptide repeat protein [Streptomyces purpureus]GGT49032.1 hypothetical protein GCM10014713_49080 [Streptomyces purpureus]